VCSTCGSKEVFRKTMSATAAQIQANQANAQLSTGPRTEQGKAVASVNSRKHGFSARLFALRTSEAAPYADFHREFRDQLQPRGALEDYHFEMFVQAAWNLLRLRQAEGEILISGDNPFLNERTGRALDRLCRYKRGLERAQKESLEALRALQTERALRAALEAEEAAALPPLARVETLTKRSQSDPALASIGRAINALDMQTKALAVSERLSHLAGATPNGS
jgi:hypothetical protein